MFSRVPVGLEALALANTSCSAMAFCDTGSPWFLLSFDDRERAASADGAEAADPLDALLVDYSFGGYAKLVGAPLSLDAILNDERAAGSAPLAWYLQITLHVETDARTLAARVPLSTHCFYFPVWNFAGDRSGSFALYSAPPTPSRSTGTRRPRLLRGRRG